MRPLRLAPVLLAAAVLATADEARGLEALPLGGWGAVPATFLPSRAGRVSPARGEQVRFLPPLGPA